MKRFIFRPITFSIALFTFSSLSFSQALPVPRVVFPSTVVGNVVTFGPATADAANAAKFSFGAAANGSVFANTGTFLATAGGSSVNLAVAGTVGNLAIAKAVGRFALKALPIFNTGVALYDLAVELGYNAKVGVNGTPSFSVVQSANVYSASCGTGSRVTAGPGSIEQVAQQCAANYQAGAAAYYGMYSCTVVGSAASYNTWRTVGTNCEGMFSYTNVADLVSTGTTEVPKTSQDLADSIAAKTSWPAGSSIARAVVDALNSGESVAVQPSAITGPASQPVSSSTIVDPVRNTSTTNTTVQNYTYGPSSVTITNSTSSTTTDRATGAVTDNGTRTDTATQPNTDRPDLSSSDTALPAAPKLYKQKYPDGLTGVWNTQRALMVGTPLFTLAKNLMPSVAMAGTCPTMPINLTFSSWANFGTKDVAPPCEVWDWGKAITIISALLLARALIFGG